MELPLKCAPLLAESPYKLKV